MNKPSLSIVTATFNGKDVLKMALERLSVQTFPMNSLEVVIVIDGSTDGTGEMLNDLRSKLPYKLRVLEQENKGPGAAHNHGALEASADIILFLADDILTTPGLLQLHNEYHLKNPQQHVAVVGKLVESRDVPQTAFQKAWNPFKGRDMAEKNELNELDFWVSQLSMKRKFFIEQGMFLEHSGAAWEDLELGNRLFKNGLKLIYCENALGYHYHPQTIDSAIARTCASGKNFVLYEEAVDGVKIHEFANILSARLKASTYTRILLRDMVRLFFFNRFTVPTILVPLIKKAETYRFLEPLVGFLTKRVVAYYFRKSIIEGRKERRLVGG